MLIQNGGTTVLLSNSTCYVANGIDEFQDICLEIVKERLKNGWYNDTDNIPEFGMSLHEINNVPDDSYLKTNILILREQWEKRLKIKDTNDLYLLRAKEIVHLDDKKKAYDFLSDRSRVGCPDEKISVFPAFTLSHFRV